MGPSIEAAARPLNRFKLAIALANKLARIAWGVLAWRSPIRGQINHANIPNRLSLALLTLHQRQAALPG
jgi:hypothetical protein